MASTTRTGSAASTASRGASQKAPAKKTPAKKAPAKKAPTKKAPATKAPAKKTPAKKAPAKKAPTKKASAPALATTSSSSPTAARVEALTGVFTALGAREPERWAQAHVELGLDQIGRFVFLRALWNRVVKDGRFLDRLRRDPGPTRDVVQQLLMAGVPEEHLVTLVRAMQVQLLVDVAQILDDPSDNDEGVRWGLWRMDRRGLPLWQLPDLRLDILDVDPIDDL